MAQERQAVCRSMVGQASDFFGDFATRAPRWHPQSLAGVVRFRIPEFPMGSGRLEFQSYRARDGAIHPGVFAVSSQCKS